MISNYISSQDYFKDFYLFSSFFISSFTHTWWSREPNCLLRRQWQPDRFPIPSSQCLRLQHDKQCMGIFKRIVYIHIYMYIHICTCTYTYMYTCMHIVCTCMHMRRVHTGCQNLLLIWRSGVSFCLWQKWHFCWKCVKYLWEALLKKIFLLGIARITSLEKHCPPPNYWGMGHSTDCIVKQPNTATIKIDLYSYSPVLYCHKSGKLQPKVIKRMSPLGVAHWKFGIESKMPKKWVIAANGDPTARGVGK